MQIPPGSARGFEASGYVDSVAMNIVVTGDDVTQIDADAQFDAMRVRKRAFLWAMACCSATALATASTALANSNQNAVTFNSDNPPSMSLDVWANQIS